MWRWRWDEGGRGGATEMVNVRSVKSRGSSCNRGRCKGGGERTEKERRGGGGGGKGSERVRERGGCQWH